MSHRADETTVDGRNHVDLHYLQMRGVGHWALFHVDTDEYLAAIAQPQLRRGASGADVVSAGGNRMLSDGATAGCIR